MVGAMEAHYSVVILAHDALLQGQLEAFREQLALVGDQELPEGSPAHWLPFHARLKAAALEGSTAVDLDSAASALAQVVFTCGSCHSALEVGQIYAAPAPDDGEDALETAMLDHQWATERMWEGVTGPWDLAWQRGAEAMATTTVFGDADPDLVLTDDLLQREAALRAIGEQAGQTTDLAERAALYGQLLATCGACHQQIGWTPDEAE
jgi:cytochrome c553